MKRLSEMKISGGQKRYIGLLLGLTFLGILLLSIGGENSSESPPPITTTETKTLTAEEKLAQILSQVEGAGQVEVEISYKLTEEKSYATNQKLRREESDGVLSEEREETIAFYNNGQGSESALVLAQKEPEIAGILIVAEGANDSEIKRQLAEAAAVLYDIPLYKVSVLKMKGGELP